MPDPSILIAFGAYGMRALRGFLASASTRGALVWDREGEVGSLNERRLESLSLFWVPDTVGSRDQQIGEHIQAENAYELMDDVFRQIRILEGSVQQVREALERGVDVEKRRLLDARRHGAATMPGLDVYIIAQPTSQAMVGHIRNLTEPAMSKLAQDPAFKTAQASSLLHFTHIFDFDDYWLPQMASIREALRRMVDENGQDTDDAGNRISSDRPAFDRMYLFDSNTIAGRRSSASRQQEVVLFLEFLLLEGLRSSTDAKTLFERSSPRQSPVGCIGVRVVERSSGLLRRLAAAAFARGMLAYIASSTLSADRQTPLFEELLKPFRAARLSQLIGEPELRKVSLKEIALVEEALLALPPLQTDWVQSLQGLAARRTEAAVLTLSERSGAQSSGQLRIQLKEFRDRIEEAITGALQDQNSATTLGSIISELQKLEDEFAAAADEVKATATEAAQTASPFEEAGRMQREYFLYARRQVRTAELRVNWWPRAAIIFAIAFSPILADALANTPVSGLCPPWVLTPVAALLLGILFWFFGRSFLSPALSRVAQRALDFYTDHDRGRLSERVRQAARSAGVTGRIESYTESLIYGLKQYVLGAVADEFRRARITLSERKEEVLWLREQVGEFLRSNHVDEADVSLAFQQGRITSDVCVSLERTEDLEEVASSIPLTEDRFREQIRVHQLFHNWPQRFCPTFLHPLPFLDELSTSFADKYVGDEADSNRRAQQIVDFLKRQARAPICFHWLAADRLPTVEKGSLLPIAWKGLPGVSSALTKDSGFSQRTIETSNAERLYLFQSMLGVPAELLMEVSLPSSGENS